MFSSYWSTFLHLNPDNLFSCALPVKTHIHEKPCRLLRKFKPFICVLNLIPFYPSKYVALTIYNSPESLLFSFYLIFHINIQLCWYFPILWKDIFWFPFFFQLLTHLSFFLFNKSSLYCAENYSLSTAPLLPFFFSPFKNYVKI